ncbi:aldehyde dehydrogenase family protein [Arenibacterium sp. LLYu02]|uniref:aldehyde dehydrogenase family protein n=1 Tax=Arenibacterium sp. LLYu02 TaxID=3404132 RepID=UPI003B21C902
MSSLIETPQSHYINGAWQAASRHFDVLNPLDDSLVTRAAAGTRAEAEAAIAAADRAFPAWAALAPGARQALFLKAAEITERRHDEIVHLLAIEAGTARAFASFQVRLSANLMRQAASWGYLPCGDLLRSDTPGRMAMVQRKPLGVVAGFTPWNGAFFLAWRTILLPMAFGNTVVIKPSELAPVTAGLLQAEILHEAGFPPGTLNVVTHAPGEAEGIADAFFDARAVRSINFTGSDRTARILGARAGQALKRMVLELGGYNPMLVLEDADLDHAAQAVNFGAFFHQGQICMNTRKVYVARAVHDAFVAKLAARTRTLKAGNPLEPGVVVGPLISDGAVAQTKARIAEALAKGATLVTGGTCEGRIHAPTILTHVPKDALATKGCDETFGPLLVIEAFDEVEAALQKAQDTPYGLSAAIMTGNAGKGLELASRFDTGIVHVNGATMAGEASLPNGGVKDSGWGRSGHYAVEDFTEIRLATVTHGPGMYPF